MKTLIRCLMALFMLTASLAPVPAQDLPQTKWVGDLPITPALKVEPGLGFAFESPGGRIVMIYLSGSMEAEGIRAYYGQALPPLGWNATGDMTWKREGERLKIERVMTTGLPLWKIMLQPE